MCGWRAQLEGSNVGLQGSHMTLQNHLLGPGFLPLDLQSFLRFLQFNVQCSCITLSFLSGQLTCTDLTTFKFHKSPPQSCK